MITTEEERSFLQQRIAFLAKLLFFLSSLFCALLWGLVLLVPGAVNREHWVNVFSTGSHLALLGVTWLIASRFRLSARLLSLADVLPMLAVSLTLGVIAVIGLLLPQEKAGAQAISRFEREVQLTARLTHPNTVSIFDYGRSVDGVFYYAMEYLDGVELGTLVQERGAQPLGRVAHIALGATAYFLITGSDVFQGRTVVDVLSQHIHAPPEPPASRLGAPIDAGFEALVLQCLAKTPAQRPQSALEIRDRSKAWLMHESWTEAEAADWWREWRREHAVGARSFDAAAMRLTVGLEARPSGYDGTRRGHDAA